MLVTFLSTHLHCHSSIVVSYICSLLFHIFTKINWKFKQKRDEILNFTFELSHCWVLDAQILCTFRCSFLWQIYHTKTFSLLFENENIINTIQIIFENFFVFCILSGFKFSTLIIVAKFPSKHNEMLKKLVKSFYKIFCYNGFHW